MSEGVELMQIARIVKSNGTDGGLIMSFRDILPEDIDIQEPVFVYCDGLPVPFFISSLVPKGTDKAVVKIVDINTFDDAEELVGQAVFADADNYEDVCSEDGDFSALIGWRLVDAEDTEVGEITDYEDIPGNPCLYIDTKNGQMMMPLSEDLILSVDENGRILKMRIPDGLL